MANGAYLRQMRRIFDGGTVAGLSEGQLLERFISRRDEAAFEALVIRHGPMVFGVCRRILRDPSEAEDAFQATFLVLVRQARSIRGRDSLGGWLHRVAYRVAIRASVNRRRPEPVELDSLATPEAADRDLIALIHEELDRLPSKYRVPIILCDLENHTYEEAAQALHWPLGTVKGRLSRARNLLRDRLIRRGVGAPSLALGLALGRDAKAIVSPMLLDSTVRAALSVAAGKVLIAGAASAAAVGLAQGVSRTMFLQTIKLSAAALIAVSLVGVAGVGTLAQVPSGEGKGAIVAEEPKQVEPLPATEPTAENPRVAGPDADITKLQGSWILSRQIIRYGGKQFDLRKAGDKPVIFGEIGQMFTIDGYTIVGHRSPTGAPQVAAKIEMYDRGASPKQIDISPTENQIPASRGVPVGKGIYTLNGNDELTVCYDPIHPELRPRVFPDHRPLTAHDTQVVSVFKRAPIPEVTETHANGNLIGCWKLVSAVREGRELEMPKSTVVYADKWYGEIDEKGLNFKGRYEVNTDKEPWRLEYLSETTGFVVIAGIYKIEGDRLAVCLALWNADEVISTPSKFESMPGSSYVLLTYKWVGPLTEDLRKQLQQSRDEERLEREERLWKLTEAMAKLQPRSASTPPVAAETHPNGSLPGCWKLVSITQGGVEDFSSKWTAVFTDDWYGEIYGDRVDFKGPYEVEKDAEPWRFKLRDANNGGIVLAEIYKIEGDRLTVCLVPANPRGAASFPTDFESGPGSRNVLYTYEWAGPITGDIRSQLQKTRNDQRKQREAQRRRLTEVAEGREPLPPVEQPNEGPIRAPVDLDAMRVEKELAEMEVASLKSRIMDLYKNIRSQEDEIFRAKYPEPSVERATPEELRAMIDTSERLSEALKKVTTDFFHKSKDLSRFARELKALSAPPEEPGLSPTLSNSLPAASRLADFDRRIHALQQQRDAYLMSLPDEERQTLLKQLAP